MSNPQDPATNKLRETAPNYSITGGNSAEHTRSPRVTGGVIDNFRTPQSPQAPGHSVDDLRAYIQRKAAGQTSPVTIESVTQGPKTETVADPEQFDTGKSTPITILAERSGKLAKAA